MIDQKTLKRKPNHYYVTFLDIRTLDPDNLTTEWRLEDTHGVKEIIIFLEPLNDKSISDSIGEISFDRWQDLKDWVDSIKPSSKKMTSYLRRAGRRPGKIPLGTLPKPRKSRLMRGKRA